MSFLETRAHHLNPFCCTTVITCLWPPCIADADIIFVRCGFFFFFITHLISTVTDWIPTIFPHMALSANLHTRQKLAARRPVKIQDTNSRQNSSSAHHHTTLSGYILATKAHIDNPKNNLLNSNLLQMSHNMINFGPLAAEISPLV